jgi:hypothetical protein
VDLGGALAPVGSQDATRVLNEPSLEGYRCCQEQCVERRAVEALPDIRAGGHHQQRGAFGAGFESFQRGCPDLCSHPTAQNNWVTTFGSQGLSQSLDVRCPLGQH